MKKMENFLRRVLSMVLCLCMLTGNVGVSFAENTATVISESTGLLSDLYDVQFDGTQTIHTQLGLTYVGTSDYVWNGTVMDTLDKNYAWYWVDTVLSMFRCITVLTRVPLI